MYMCTCSYISFVFPPISACASCRYSLRPSRALEAPVQGKEEEAVDIVRKTDRSNDWRLFFLQQQLLQQLPVPSDTHGNAIV